MLRLQHFQANVIDMQPTLATNINMTTYQIILSEVLKVRLETAPV